MPDELNCTAFLYPLSVTGEAIPGRRLVVLGVLGIAGVTSCVAVASLTTASSPVILVSVGVVGLGLLATLCSGKWITVPYFVDATRSCGSGCSWLVTSPILSFCRSCTDAWRLWRDVAFPSHLFFFPDTISPDRMSPSVSWLCKNRF